MRMSPSNNFYQLMIGQNMLRLYFFVFLFLYNHSSFSEKLNDIKLHCINNTCSKVIKKIRIKINGINLDFISFFKKT